MDIDILAGLISFAALVIVWAFAPSKPASSEVSVPAKAAREALA
jgi:hypothetical protein